MSAYVVTDVEVTDASLYGQFLEQVTTTVESHGGRFVVRGGGIEVIEGDWTLLVAQQLQRRAVKFGVCPLPE